MHYDELLGLIIEFKGQISHYKVSPMPDEIVFGLQTQSFVSFKVELLGH